MKLTAIVFPAVLATLGLQACSVSGPRESPLPKTGPKMIDIYERHVAENTAHAATGHTEPARRWYDDAQHPAATAADSDQSARFARLPNPDLTMYVYPHLAKGKYPIPGYATVFPMFESVQYALPGEVTLRPVPGPGAAPDGALAVQMPTSR